MGAIGVARYRWLVCGGGMEIGLAWCGGASARGFKVRVLRWRSGVAGALLRRWGCGSSGWLRGWCCGSSAVEQSEISEHSEHSEGLADARSFSRCSALRKRRGAYGCHLPARGGPPTCAGLLLAWWGIGGAVGGRGRFAARCALLQQALDFMQLFFLDLCFTALFFEVPAPL